MAARRKKSAPAKAAPEPVLEEVDEGKGLGIDGGIVISTFLLLVGALALVWTLLGERYPGA